MRAFTLAALFALGCSDPSYQNGNLRCATSASACPEGFHCAADQTCWRNGQEPDLAVSDLAIGAGDAADAALDGPPRDLFSIYDLTPDDSGCDPVDPSLCCGQIVTACNVTINCLVDCTGQSTICGASGYPNQCGCPSDSRSGIYRLVNGDQKHCYSNAVSPGNPVGDCAGYTIEGTTPKFYAYTGDPMPGLVHLLRCLSGTKYFLSLDSNCDGVAGAVQDSNIGFVPGGPQCGAVALHRYDAGATAGMFYTTDPNEKPAGATEVMPPFYVYPN